MTGFAVFMTAYVFQTEVGLRSELQKTAPLKFIARTLVIAV